MLWHSLNRVLDQLRPRRQGVVMLADAAVTVVATTVSVGATVVGTAVDVTAAGVKAVAGTDDEEDDADEAPRVEAGDAAPQAALHTAPQP